MGFGFPNPVPAWSDSVSILPQVTCPSCHLWYASFLCFEGFFSEATFSHMQTPATFAWFPPHGDEPFLSLEEVVLELHTDVLDPSPLQGRMPWVYSKQVPEHPKVCSPEALGYDPAFCLYPFFQDPELHLLMATAVNLTFTSPTSPSMFVSVKSGSQPLIVGLWSLSLGICHWCSPQTWVACVLLCCSSSRYWGG